MSPSSTKSTPRKKSTAARRPSPGSRRPAPPSKGRGRVGQTAVLAVAITAAAVLAIALLARAGDGGGGSAASGAGSFVGGDLHTLAVDAATPSRMFVGGHEGVATSPDGGRTWTQIASLRDADAMGWAFAGTDVWVGGHPGLKRSTDGGRTFAAATGDLDGADVHALGGGGDLLYAASPAKGFLASTDGGRTWEVRSAQDGRGFMGTLVVDPSDPQHVIAPDMQAGAVETTDGGRTWRRLGGPGMAMSVSTIGGDMSKLVVAGSGAAARSDDGGRTWRALDVPEGTMVVTGGEGSALYAASLDGTSARVSTSTDGGATWRALNP